MPYEQTEYEVELRKKKIQEKATYALALFIRGIYYIVKLFLTVIWGAVKGVLQTFGVPIR